jgi:hypothetical protein
MKRRLRDVIKGAQAMWKGVKETMRRDGTPFVVISPPAQWQTGPIGSMGFFYTLEDAITNARGLLQHHGEVARIQELVGDELKPVNWQRMGGKRHHAGGKNRHVSGLTTTGTYRGYKYEIKPNTPYPGIGWYIDLGSAGIRRSQGAFYDVEDHPEGAYTWAEASAREYIDKMLTPAGGIGKLAADVDKLLK